MPAGLQLVILVRLLNTLVVEYIIQLQQQQKTYPLRSVVLLVVEVAKGDG
jgi:hypothetical protein